MTNLSSNSDYLAIARQKKAEEVRSIYEQHPELREVEQALMTQVTALTRAMALFTAGGNSALERAQIMADYQAAIATLNVERARMLKKLDLPDNYAQLDVQCVLCNDTGLVSVNGHWQLCSCRLSQQFTQKKLQAGLTPRLQNRTFANFALEHYALTSRSDSAVSAYERASKALLACRQFVENAATTKSGMGLYIYGNTGVGKTHLAAATANALLEQGVEVRYEVASHLLASFRATYNDDPDTPRESDIMEELCSIPVLIIDDIATESYSAWAVERLYQIVNSRYNQGLPMVLTSNIPFGELAEALGDASAAVRISSRIAEVCRIHWMQGDDLRFVLR